MKIDDIHIDGFGRFNQFSIEDLNPGLTIFSGANEAGKSTLLAFIRCVLFGFSSARSGTNQYPPLYGGKHGGRLVMTTDSDERCVIERYVERGGGVKVRLQDGSMGGADELSKLLGYADQTIFENVYAFGLSELQKFESLNNDSIRDKLYSVGAGFGSVSISDVQKHLRNQYEGLYKKQGRKPPINKLFSDMNKLDSTINDLEKDQNKYDSLHRDLEEKSALIEQLKNEHLDIETNRNHVNDIISIWDDWVNLLDSKANLEDLPILDNFPENGLNNLERILEKIEESADSISSIKEDINKNEIVTGNIVLNEELLQQRDAILDLCNGIEKYRSECESLPSLRSKLIGEQSDFHDMLNELGPQWDEEKLNRFDRSIPAREIVIQKHKAIEEIETEIIDVKHESMQVNRDIGKIDTDVEENQEK
ncbi:MAG: AAA family ATPase, partial [ANME-2 cluster archaeon]|nr:AAA family ATPase [ANME-2 cluster archaeon]